MRKSWENLWQNMTRLDRSDLGSPTVSYPCSASKAAPWPALKYVETCRNMLIFPVPWTPLNSSELLWTPLNSCELLWTPVNSCELLWICPDQKLLGLTVLWLSLIGWRESKQSSAGARRGHFSFVRSLSHNMSQSVAVCRRWNERFNCRYSM